MPSTRNVVPIGPGAAKILGDLPQEMQGIQVLRALIRAEEAGYQRAKREFANRAAVDRLCLSSSRRS